jgi:hypothetical protein
MCRPTLDLYGNCVRKKRGAVMRLLLIWIAVPLMLLGAAMLIAGIGAHALWIGTITVGIALVAVTLAQGRTVARH